MVSKLLFAAIGGVVAQSVAPRAASSVDYLFTLLVHVDHFSKLYTNLLV
jgi:hypothetical protein